MASEGAERRAPLVGGLPVMERGARDAARGDGRRRARSRGDRRARGLERRRRRARGVRRLADDPRRRAGRPAVPESRSGSSCRVYRLRDGRVSPLPDRAGGAADSRWTRSKEATTDGTRDGHEGRRARARARAARHRRRDRTPCRRPARRRRPWWSGRATTAPTRSPGTTASSRSARDYEDRGVRFLAVNSNDAERYPADSLEAMRERVEAEDWPFPYLHDESQDAARAWAAAGDARTSTSLDAELPGPLRGRAGRRPHGPGQEAAWLREALDAVLAGRGAPASRHRPRRVLDQVEAVVTR